MPDADPPESGGCWPSNNEDSSMSKWENMAPIAYATASGAGSACERARFYCARESDGNVIRWGRNGHGERGSPPDLGLDRR